MNTCAPRHRTTRRHVPDLTRLLDTCACNYERLNGLLLLATGVEAFPERDAVHILELDADRYTTTLELREQGRFPGIPHRLIVRLYHDAALAEVLQWPDKRILRGSYPYPNTHMAQRDEKEQSNRFLTEWLQDLVARRVALFYLQTDRRP